MAGGALREIIASFGVEFDAKELEHGEGAIKGMLEKLEHFGKAVAEAFIVKEVVEFGMHLAEQAEQLEIHATILGMSTDALQKWQYAANLSGVSAEELQGSLQKMSRSVVAAGGSGAKLGPAFAHLDFKRADGTFKDTDELLTDVTETIGGMTDSTMQAAAAAQIFGRSGARMLPFLKKGKAGIEEMKNEVDELGGGMSKEFVEASSEMIKNVKRLGFALIGAESKGAGSLIDMISVFAEKASKFVAAAGDILGNSNAMKTALIVLGIAGAQALLPLLLSIAPILISFLALEDAITFLTGGDSEIGDWVERNFGEGSAEKLQAFFKQITDSGIADALQALKDVFAIFTDGKPLDEKFVELMTYVDGTMRPQLVKDFGAVGDEIALMTELLSGSLAVMNKIIDAMVWLTAHSPVGSLVTTTIGAFAERKKLNEGAAAGGKVVTAADYQAEHDAKPWYARAAERVFLGKFDAAGMVPVDTKALTQQVASESTVGQQMSSAPVNQSLAPPLVSQDNKITVIQNFHADTPEEVQKAAANGASEGSEKGASKGGQSLLSTQGAVKKQGG